MGSDVEKNTEGSGEGHDRTPGDGGKADLDGMLDTIISTASSAKAMLDAESISSTQQAEKRKRDLEFTMNMKKKFQSEFQRDPTSEELATALKRFQEAGETNTAPEESYDYANEPKQRLGPGFVSPQR